MKEIRIREIKVEKADCKGVELIYIPDHTQVLQEGRPYRIVLAFEELEEPEKR